MQIEINKNDLLDKYQNRFNDVKTKLNDLSPAFKDFEMYYTGLIKKNYYERGSVFGNWKRNSQSYEMEKRILVHEGTVMSNGKKAIRLEPMRLTDELKLKTFSKGAVRITQNSIEYKVGSDYGVRLHPTRPFLYTEKDGGLRGQDYMILTKMIEKYLAKDMENEQNN